MSDNSKANANLIAAAPELLDSLYRLLDHAEFSAHNWHSMIDAHKIELRDRIKAARAAIAKAKGES